MRNEIEQFRAAMRAVGLEPPDRIEPGNLHRFPSNGKRGDDAGWCKLFADLRGGVFGDHRSGLSEHWQAKTDRVMTAGEREAFQRMVAESKHQAELEEHKRHEAAALKAVAILDAATGDPTTHPYAIKKRVPLGSLVKRGAWPQRGWNDALLAPIYGSDGGAQSIEAINTDGRKDSLKDANKRGGFYPFGKVRGASRVFIAEGVANAAVGAEVDNSPAVAALCAGNLKAVTLAVRELAAPGADIILLADNDPKPDGSNPGLKAANEAAAVGGRVAIPELEGRKCDFWDVWNEHGVEAVRSAIANATTPVSDEHGSDTENAPGGETYDSLIQRAATADVASVSGIMAKIAEAGLSRTKQETILRKLKDSTGATLQALRGDLIGALKDAGVIGDQDTGAAILIDLAREAGVELWHDPDKNPWATLQLDDHIEHHPLKTKAVRRYLQKLYFESTGGGNGKGKAAGGEAMQAALGVLEAKAVFDGETHKPYIRVAEANGVIYLDLCNEAWEVVRITANGWQVVAAKDCSMRFRRSRGMQALPYPTNGAVGLLATVLGEDMEGPNWKLIVGWQLGSLRGDIPFPVLCVNGEQGSGKSTRCKMIRGVIDPNTSSLRNTPRESRDLFISASNSWIQCFDNVSGLSDWLSDDLCRLATGGGLATRELYTDDEETILDVRRPIILNGITDFITRPDLIDRTCLVTFPAIPEENRKSESDILVDFESAHSKILGALLTIASAGLRELPNTRLEKLPRMADFALWVTACEEALGWERTSFVETFAEARQDMIGAALDAEPIFGPMRRLVEQGECTGSTSELRYRLITLAGLDPAKRLPDGWPKNANALGHKLKRLAPALREHGIYLKHLPKNADGSRPWTVGTCVARPLGKSRDKNAVNPVIAETASHKAYGDGVVQPMSPRTPSRTPSPKPAPDKAYGDDGDDGDVFPSQSSAGGGARTVRGFIE